MNDIEIAVAAAILLLVQLIGSARDALFDRGTILPDADAPDAPEYITIDLERKTYV